MSGKVEAVRIGLQTDPKNPKIVRIGLRGFSHGTTDVPNDFARQLHPGG